MRYIFLLFCLLSFQVAAKASFQGFNKSWVSDVCVGSFRSSKALASCLNSASVDGFTFIASASRGWVHVDFYQDGKWRVHSENYIAVDDNEPCPYGEDETGQCKDKPPEENYCQSSEAISEMKRMREACVSQGDPKTQNIESHQSCDNDSRHIDNVCKITNKDTGSGSGGSGSGGSGSGGSGSGGSGSGGSGSGGSGSGGSGSGGSGSGGSGSGGSGSGGSGSGGSGSGGSGSGGSGSGGSGSGGSGSGGDKGVNVDLSGVISSINAFKGLNDSNLKALKSQGAKELQEWNKTTDLLTKYYETAKVSSSSLDHMSKFSEQELATLRTMQGEYGTHFDRIYNSNQRLIDATKQFNNDSNDKLVSIDTVLTDLKNDLNVENINKALKENLKDPTAPIEINTDKLEEKIDEKSDKQTEAIVKSVNEAATKITNDIKVKVDNSELEGVLNSIDGKLGELGKGGQGSLGGCRSNNSCESLIESSYPNGVAGVMDGFMGKVKETAYYSFVDNFKFDANPMAPTGQLCANFGFANYGCFDLSIPDIIWTFIRACMMFTAAMTCRKLIFGG